MSIHPLYVSCTRAVRTEGSRFVVGKWEFRFGNTPRVVLAPAGRGKSYYLSMPNTLTPPYVTDTFLSLCHINIYMNEFSHPQDGDSWSTVPEHHMIQQPGRRSITTLKTWKVTTIFKTWQAMYISGNIVTRWRNHFASKNTTMHCVCFVVDLHVIVNYIKMLSVEHDC